MSPFQSTLAIVLGVLRDQHIEPLMVGGLVVNYYGYTRLTLDIAFMMALPNSGVDATVRAMKNAGFTSCSINWDMLRDIPPVQIEWQKQMEKQIKAAFRFHKIRFFFIQLSQNFAQLMLCSRRLSILSRHLDAQRQRSYSETTLI